MWPPSPKQGKPRTMESGYAGRQAGKGELARAENFRNSQFTKTQGPPISQKGKLRQPAWLESEMGQLSCSAFLEIG